MKDDPRSGQPKTQKTGANVDNVQTLVHSDLGLGMGLIEEEINGNVLGGRDQKFSLRNGFSTMTMPLHMMHYEFAFLTKKSITKNRQFTYLPHLVLCNSFSKIKIGHEGIKTC
jgi:hypothetical protein